MTSFQTPLRNFLLALLQPTKGNTINLNHLSKEIHTSTETLKQYASDLAQYGLATFINREEISVTAKQRLARLL